MATHRRPLVLMVGGHDPSGAGIDADLAAVRDLAVEASAIATALTDQDDHSLRSIGARDPDAWRAEALLRARTGVGAIKFGLLPGAAHVRAARELVREIRKSARTDVPAVVDPVIRASSGGQFLDAEALDALRGDLAAEGVVLTPNLPEAAEITGLALASLRDSLEVRLDAARRLLSLGARAVVIKGGHGPEDPVRDLVARAEGGHVWIERSRIHGGKIRGSGCRFAARLAAGLALGEALEAAAEEAGRFVAGEIAHAAGSPRRSGG